MFVALFYFAVFLRDSYEITYQRRQKMLRSSDKMFLAFLFAACFALLIHAIGIVMGIEANIKRADDTIIRSWLSIARLALSN
ncbi:MAG TPA: hypothetical protein VH164_08120 [Ktedonobacteraceae bacterium]|nr:hypothetical protein [Ktedonobacteraceae bacterium]